MKHPLVTALAVGLLSAALPLAALAEDASPKGPPKTMGDEGTLPSTSTVGGHVPHMGTAPTDQDLAPLTPKGPQSTMGDEGKLPATGAGSSRVPNMTGPDSN
jgi:hypothetical protein